MSSQSWRDKAFSLLPWYQALALAPSKFLAGLSLKEMVDYASIQEHAQKNPALQKLNQLTLEAISLLWPLLNLKNSYQGELFYLFKDRYWPDLIAQKFEADLDPKLSQLPSYEDCLSYPYILIGHQHYDLKDSLREHLVESCPGLSGMMRYYDELNPSLAIFDQYLAMRIILAAFLNYRLETLSQEDSKNVEEKNKKLIENLRADQAAHHHQTLEKFHFQSSHSKASLSQSPYTWLVCMDPRSDILRYQVETLLGHQSESTAGCFAVPLVWTKGTEREKRAPFCLEDESCFHLEDKAVPPSSLSTLMTDWLGHLNSFETVGLSSLEPFFQSSHPKINLNEQHLERLIELYGAEKLALSLNTFLKNSLNPQSTTDYLFIVGHYSSAFNEWHQPLYQCGACGGYTGSEQAWLTAALLNHPKLRAYYPTWPSVLAIAYNTAEQKCYHLPTSHEEKRFKDIAMSSLKQLNQALASSSAIKKFQPFFWPSLSLRLDLGLVQHRALYIGPSFVRSQAYYQEEFFFFSYYQHDDGSDEARLLSIFQGPVEVAHQISLMYFCALKWPSLYSAGSKNTLNLFDQQWLMQENQSDLLTGPPQESLFDKDGQPFGPAALLSVYVALDHESLVKTLNHPQAEGLRKKIQQELLVVYSYCPISSESHKVELKEIKKKSQKKSKTGQ